jgi:hypothetical protein
VAGLSNITVERFKQQQKQPEQSIVTDDGMRIDLSEHSRKTLFSNRKSLEPASNKACERRAQ